MVRLTTIQQIHLLALRDGGTTLPEIRARIEAATGKRYTPGQIYTTLDRLCSRGSVKSDLRLTLNARGRRSMMRHFALTGAGRRSLATAVRQPEIKAMLAL